MGKSIGNLGKNQTRSRRQRVQDFDSTSRPARPTEKHQKRKEELSKSTFQKRKIKNVHGREKQRGGHNWKEGWRLG